MEAGGDVGGRAGRERPRPADPAAGTPVLPDPSELPGEVREARVASVPDRRGHGRGALYCPRATCKMIATRYFLRDAFKSPIGNAG